MNHRNHRFVVVRGEHTAIHIAGLSGSLLFFFDDGDLIALLQEGYS